MRSIFLLLAGALPLVACQSEQAATEAEKPAEADANAAVPGDTDETEPYSEIAEDEVLRFTGTEPFWGGEVCG